MSTIKNHVQLIGNVGQEPTITNLESGKKVARFSLATPIEDCSIHSDIHSWFKKLNRACGITQIKRCVSIL